MTTSQSGSGSGDSATLLHAPPMPQMDMMARVALPDGGMRYFNWRLRLMPLDQGNKDYALLVQGPGDGKSWIGVCTGTEEHALRLFRAISTFARCDWGPTNGSLLWHIAERRRNRKVEGAHWTLALARWLEVAKSRPLCELEDELRLVEKALSDGQPIDSTRIASNTARQETVAA